MKAIALTRPEYHPDLVRQCESTGYVWKQILGISVEAVPSASATIRITRS